MLLSNLALGTVHGVSLATVFQQPAEVKQIDPTLLMWFVGIAALAIVIQMLILLGAAIGGMKIAKDLMKIVEEARAKAMPLIDSTQGLVKDLTPQIKQITNKVEVIVGNVENISGVAVEKVHEFAPTVSRARETVEQANQTARDANRKTHEQIERINGMVTSVLDSTVRAGEAIQRGITMPGREISGWMSGLKAGFNSLMGKAKHFAQDRPLGGHRSRDEGSGMEESGFGGSRSSSYGRGQAQAEPAGVIVVEEDILVTPVRPANPAVLGSK